MDSMMEQACRVKIAGCPLSRILFFLLPLAFISIVTFAPPARGLDIEKVQKYMQADGVATGDSGSGDIGGSFSVKRESLGMVVARIFGWLALILAVMFGVFWVLKRVGFSGAAKSASGTLDIVENLPVGQGRFITLVRVMDEIFVIGHTGQSIQLLGKIEGAKAVELIASSKGGTSIVQFKDMFNSFVDKMKKPQ